MLALFNMITVSHGAVHIDDLAIATVSPERLRSALNAIPQEPYFLDDTIRMNADPYGTRTDDEIWRAIAAVHLTSVMQSKGGLNTVMTNDTLSHGERQLFCLARAILKGCKIVVLDEATSKYVHVLSSNAISANRLHSIDVETEKLIRKTIDEEFKDCTVITIAHRLETIMTSDRIAVLEAGELVEFEKPEVLLSRDSKFKRFFESY
jgi:ABC-type multidrug transport system fused ATPase/permease subunit